MLPPPTITFTIPSIHDDLVLDCRIYIPSRFVVKKAAIVAHPYAPLGGCYDDPIVDIVGSTLLKQEYVVGTFNFRGAGHSKGRTSWTSKAETNDYISVTGLMVYFLHYLTTQDPSDYFEDDSPSYDLSPIPSHVVPAPHPPEHYWKQAQSKPSLRLDGLSSFSTSNGNDTSGNGASPKPLLLLAGYSYGSMITMSLPDTPSVLEAFTAPELGTAASEIRLRAQQLATQQNEAFALQAASLRSKDETSLDPGHKRGRTLMSNLPLSPRKVSSGVRVGGEESNSELRRSSHDSRRSFSIDAPESLRKSVDRVRSMGRRHNSAKMSPQRHKSLGSARPPSPSSTINSPPAGDSTADEKPKTTMDVLKLDDLKTCYLLVSPLQGLVNNLANMWTVQKPKRKPKISDSVEPCTISKHDTLAVFGDEDVFTSCKKLRAWATELGNPAESRFQYVEIDGAGHFWHEEGVAQRMRDAVEEFIGGL